MFQPPDLESPLDWTAAIARTPAGATVRGFFLQDTLEDLRGVGAKSQSTKSYVGFKSYPLREWMALLREAAVLVHPTLPLRRALYELGLKVYPRFAATLVGKTMFTFAGNDYGRIIHLASKAYEISSSTGRVTLVENRSGRAVARLREIYNFLDTFQVGIWRGAMTAAGVEGEVRVAPSSAIDADFELSWELRAKRTA